MTHPRPLDPGSAHEAPLDGRAALLPPPVGPEIAALAERCGYAVASLRCAKRARVALDAIGLVRAGAVALLNELGAALEDAGHLPSGTTARAAAYEVREGYPEARELRHEGWCRDLARSLRDEARATEPGGAA